MGQEREAHTPFCGRRCPFPSFSGFLMPLRWFLYDWLCAVWLVDLAMAGSRGMGRWLGAREWWRSAV